jgi:hypothetical protein
MAPMHLVKSLFEELHPAIDCLIDLDSHSMQAQLDQHFTLFNYEKKGQKMDTHLICRMELTLNYQTNKIKH